MAPGKRWQLVWLALLIMQAVSPLVAEQSGAIYSKHTCIGPANSVDGHARRICKFENICYANHEFLYYEQVPTPKLFDKRMGVQYNFTSHDGKPFITLHPHMPEAVMSPKVVVGPAGMTTNVTLLNGSHLMWQHWPVAFSMGHFLWEDLVTVYTTQRRLGEVDPAIQVISLSKTLGNPHSRFLKAVLPTLTDKPLMALEEFTSPVCFRQLLVAGLTKAFLLPNEPYLEGMEEMYMGFKDRILQNMGIVPELPQHVPVVYITHKTASVFAKSTRHSGRHRAIANALELRDYLRSTYPKAVVDTMEWHKISPKEQLHMVSHASLIITPCGGVSMNLPFLPTGAHAIIMDYLSDGKLESTFGYKEGESASMDISLWNRFPHFHKYYYQVYNKSDFEMDVDGSSDIRNDASILVDFNRIKALVTAALSTMGYDV